MKSDSLLAFIQMEEAIDGYEHNAGNWRARANCRDMDPLLFFDKYEEDRETQKFVDDVCAACPVESECDAYAEEYGLEGGVFARKYRYQSMKLKNKKTEKSKNRIKIGSV